MKANVFAFQGSMNLKINWRSTSAMLLCYNEVEWINTECLFSLFAPSVMLSGALQPISLEAL